MEKSTTKWTGEILVSRNVGHSLSSISNI